MRRPSSALVAALVAGAVLLPAAGAGADSSPPGNLGNGLARLVDPPRPKAGIRMTQAPLTIRDRQGRVLVDVFAAQGSSLAGVRRRSEDAGLEPVATSVAHRAIEGFVALKGVEGLASAPGVASVSQALRPAMHVGAATSQGVHAERADVLPRGIDGRGITVGALSDSFDTATTTVAGAPLTIHAADDIRSGDLPADGVTVVEDDPVQATADEGRAMLQIVHDVAPGARECFATADTGDFGFAANIRRLADPKGPCGADIVVDDVSYFDEPFFSRGPIGDAVDDVAAKGVHYFSSAGNGSSQQAYQAPLRMVPPASATQGTNLDLTGVDPALYAGGFHDFDAGAGVDVAQSLVLGADADQPGTGILDLQWDDPVDPAGAPLGPPLVRTTGAITAAAPIARIPFAGRAGQTIRAVVDAIPSTTTDLILTLKDPAGNVVQQVDTGSSPETAVQTLAANGTYTFEVSGFRADLGDFTFEVRPVLGTSRTTTDLNALFFDGDGNFLFAASDLNKLSGKPFEVPAFQGSGALQLVIAKANTDAGQATQLRYQLEDDLQAVEDVQPLAPGIFGHALARGATAVAAYDPFPPLLPEDYTSVGGDLPILFDSAGDRLPEPDVRRAPQVAATDGGNTTFFTADNARDPDGQPNFFGTSAAAPHAAAIAALALQAAGGPGSLSPDRMRALLQRSAFPHDLDQQHSGASVRGLRLSADGPYGFERRPTVPTDTSPGAMDDPRFFQVTYQGPGWLRSITFDGARANATGHPGGLVFDPRPFAGYPALGAPGFYDQGSPFVVGATSPGVAPTDVSASFGRPGVGFAGAQQYQRMTVRFRPGTLAGGRGVAFGIDRDEAVTVFGDAQDGNSADQLGPVVRFPAGTVDRGALSFRARTSTGRLLRGRFRNRIGAGWTPVDGFGYLDAEEAVRRAR